MRVIRMKSEIPLVSICITSYNYGCYIADAIDSALGQTYPNVEVVVSDNCSTDNTAEVLSRYEKNPRVAFLTNPENVGMVRNHNIAVMRARGEYIVVLSADDVLFPDHVSRLMERLNDTIDPVDIVHGNVMLMDEHLNAIRARSYRGALPVAYSDRDDLADILINYYHAFPAKLIPKRVYEELGYFDESIASAFDVDFCARMEFSEYRIGFIPVLVAGLRAHGARSSIGSWELQEGYLRDKVVYLEKFVKLEFGWRFEGCEKYLFGVLDYELRQVEAAQKRMLEPTLRRRYEKIMETLVEMNKVIPAWPSSRPRISIIVTSDGYLPLLQRSLDSLFAQNFTDFEVILMHGDGLSIEGWIKNLPIGPRVRYVKATSLRNFGTVRNAAMHIARGQLVTYLAEGQRVLPYHLERLLYCIDQSKAEVAFCDSKSFVDDGFSVPFDEERRAHCFEEPFVRAERLAKEGATPLATVMHRRSVFRQLAHLEDAYFTLSDEDLVSHFRLQHRHAAVSNADPAIEARYVPTQTFDGFTAGQRRAEYLRERGRNTDRSRSQVLTEIKR